MTDVIIQDQGVNVYNIFDPDIVITTLDDPNRAAVTAAVVTAATIGAESVAGAQAKADQAYQDAVTYFETRTLDIISDPYRPRLL